MSITGFILLIAALGGIGGLVNCFLSGEFHLPHFDREAKIWRPGWIGNVLIGAVAAAVVWGVYGPAASYNLTGAVSVEIPVTVAQLLSAPVVGLSGGTILTLLAQKEADKVAKEELVKLSKKLSAKDRGNV